MPPSPNLPGSASYFDQAAETYAATYAVSTPPGYALRVRQQRILELLGPEPGKLLDAGCGPAFIAKELERTRCAYWGLDGSPHMLTLAAQHLPPEAAARLAIGDVQHVPYPDGFFDSVLCIGVIERTRDDRAVLRELLRVLKPGGTLVVSFPNLLSPYCVWKNLVFYPMVTLLRPTVYRLRRKPLPPAISDGSHSPLLGRLIASASRLYTARATSRWLDAMGADLTDVIYALYNPCLPPVDELLPGLTRRVMGRLEGMRTGPLRWLGWTFLAKYRKRQ